VQMQADPESGSVDFINFDSPLELLQTLLQQVGGAATVNKLCKVYSKMAKIIVIIFLFLHRPCRIKQVLLGTKDSRNNMAHLLKCVVNHQFYLKDIYACYIDLHVDQIFLQFFWALLEL